MKILIVDDDVLMLKALKFRMNKDGYEVDTAEDGRKAIECIDSSEYDLVLTDVMLPFKNGLDIVQHIKSDTSKKTKVVILTAVGVENAVTDGFAMGADEYITKPFSPSELSIRVKKLLATA